MVEELENILKDATLAISNACTIDELDKLKLTFLGKKGIVTIIAAKMKDLGKEEKPATGKALNKTRSVINDALEAKVLNIQAKEDKKVGENIDVTLPGNPLPRVGRHPISQMLSEAVNALRRMGFSLANGPEIETEWHCFDALNTPEDHPARNESDTFYFADGRLLRTHTSTVQIRTMQNNEPPVRIISPGAAYRRDEIDATHLSQFNQLEGLYVDKNVSLADLKGTLEYLLHSIFGKETRIRFRPHFFPFTEPSFEIDILLQAQGKQPKWIEVAGCGMVDPNVFLEVNKSRGDNNYSPDQVSGFAFGLGLERLAMIRWGISDIRLLIENDIRFLHQFA